MQKNKTEKRPIGKVQVGGVGPHHTCRFLSPAERKANLSEAKLGFIIFSVSFFTLSSSSNPIYAHPPTPVHKIPIFLCAKTPLFLSGSSACDLFLWIYCRFSTLTPLSSLPLSPASKLFIFLFIYQFLLQF